MSSTVAPPEARRARPPGRRRRLLVRMLIGLAAILVAIQLVPYGRAHTNPPVSAEPRWDSPQTRALALRSCGDCHSSATVWPWYSNVAPVSWLVQRDVDGGRGVLDFSTWDRPQDAGIDDIAEQIRSGSMPPWYYRLQHSRATLSKSDEERLISGLRATFAASPPIGGR